MSERRDDEDLYSTLWLRTKLGTMYYMPDMLSSDIDHALRQLDAPMEEIAIRNISGVIMVIPKRIIQSAGVGERKMWEAT